MANEIKGLTNNTTGAAIADADARYASIDAGGRLIQPVQAVTATATITGSRVKFTGSTASQTLTLMAGAVGLTVGVRNAGSVAVSIARAGSDTIEGETTLTLNPGESALLTFVGTDWTVF